MKRYLKDYAFLFLVAGTIILFDQLTKYFIRSNLQIGEIYRPDLWLSDFVRIVHWKNTGAAFGMFQNWGQVFMILSFMVSLFIAYYFPQVPPKDWLIRLAMGMLLGGAVGNLIDRLTEGHVTDFISVGNFPVFNIADSSISVGVVVLFLGMWKQERDAKIEAECLRQAEVSATEAVPAPEQAEMEGRASERVLLTPEEEHGR